MKSLVKLTLSICALLSIEVASAQTNSVTNRIASTAFVSNYVRGAFNPNQFNTNSYPYTLSNVTGSVTINNVTVSNTLQFLPNTNNPGFVLTADANGFGYWASPTNGLAIVSITNISTSGIITSKTNLVYSVTNTGGLYMFTGSIGVSTGAAGSVVANLTYNDFNQGAVTKGLLPSTTMVGVGPRDFTNIVITPTTGNINLVVTLSGDGGSDVYQVRASLIKIQ